MEADFFVFMSGRCGLHGNLVAEGQHDDAIAGLGVAAVLQDVGKADVVAGIDDDIAKLEGQADGDGEIDLFVIIHHAEVALLGT